MKHTARSIAAAILSLFLIPACGEKKETSNRDITAEAQAFYKSAKNEKGELFYRFQTPADLPADLKWEDGSEQEEFGSPDAKKGGTYHASIPDYPRTLRPIGQDANEAMREYVQDYFYLQLLNRHPNTLQPFPACAMQWARGADKKTFYFKLDPDARFSDGEPVRADNFLFTFFFMRSNYHKDVWYQEQYFKRYENLTKYDDLTIAITMADAKPDAIEHAGSVQPTPLGFFKTLGDDYLQAYNWKFQPTTGAYEIKESGLKKGQSVTLTKVKNWWAKDKKFYRQLFNPDRIELDVIRDPNKVVEVFRNGEIDAFRLNVPELWYKKFPDNDPLVENGYIEKVTFYNQAPVPTYGFYVNSSRPLLNNRDIREGLQHACNWDLVIKQVFYGDYERMNIAQEGFGQFTDTSIKAREFDPAKAAEYFAKAGFTTRGSDGTFQDAQGQRLAFTITNSYKRLESALVVIQQEAKKAGVDLSIETPEPTAAWKKFNERNHDLAFSAFNVSVEMYPRFWEEWHGSNAYEKDGKIKTDTNNFTMTADKEMDAWIDRYDKSSDVAEMKELAWKIETKLHESAAFIPAFKMPWYRVGHWRWLKFPDHFDVRTSRDFEETWTFWIDEDERKATAAAMKSGKSLGKSVKVFEQWHQK